MDYLRIDKGSLDAACEHGFTTIVIVILYYT